MPTAADPPIAYLDHAASTPMRPEAIAAVHEVLEAVPGNPSGQHRAAREARRRLDDARDQVAAAVGCTPGEVVFTSGGTEADDLAVLGVVAATGGRALCLATDHHAAIEPVRAVDGQVVDLAGPGRWPSVASLAAALAGGPASVVSVAAVNNEVGVVERLDEVADVVRACPGAVLHVDAVAAAGWLDLRDLWPHADLLSLSGHKVGGPKGIGALVVRSGTLLAPLVRGGAQERGRRGGTPNLPGAVGMGVALAAADADRPATAARVAALRDRLRAGLLAEMGDAVAEVVPPGDGVALAPHLVHLCCRSVHRDALLFRLDEQGIAASAGSSCASGAAEPSHVVGALGVAPDLRDGALRLSLGWTTTGADVDRALAVVPAAVRDLQGTAGSGAVRS
ncbi:MAG: aminotransferase class V-fold PLP-dependent enzyme [Acidimicrobiales bacterium]